MNNKTLYKKNINIKNKKIIFEYNLLDSYIAGIQLIGIEIKAIRKNKANISDSFCKIINNEIYIINMHIYGYNTPKYNPKRERKLLLNKKEILKLSKSLKDIGLTIIPYKLFISDSGFAKIKIFLAKGKKLYDKRRYIRDRDIKRENKIYY